MIQKYKSLRPLCEEIPSDCSFEMKSYSEGATVHNNDININYLIFCYSGHVRITSTLFHDEILCAGEVMFVPRMSDCSGIALSNITLLVHKFNNSIVSYISNEINDTDLWKLKHKELIWAFTRYFKTEELRSFFHPMTGEQVPFRSLVLTHYRKAEFTDKLAEMCGYGLHNFRKIVKKEFGMSPYRWLMIKRAENIKYKLSQTYIPFTDIIDEFNFSSPAHFSNFCKRFLGDTPSNIRKELSEKGIDE